MVVFEMTSKVTVVLGAQWGDEGKGKIVDMLAEKADIVCRCQGGNNADHNVLFNGIEYNYHLVPVGLIYPTCVNLLGNGVVVHLPDLFKELDQLEKKGLKDWENRLLISNRAHLVFDFHQAIDAFQDENNNNGITIGTTKKGIGPAYSAKTTRNGIRVEDLVNDFADFANKFSTLVGFYKNAYSTAIEIDLPAELKRYRKYAERIRPWVCDSVSFLHGAVNSGRTVVVEGANAAMLDLDLGCYPFVTSSNCCVGGVCTGLGLPPSVVGDVIGVVKVYTSRVGEGAMPTELHDGIARFFQENGNELGMTTGRTRRCGWLDLFQLQYSTMVNGYSKLCLTKLDLLDSFAEIKVGVGYKLNGKKLDSFPSASDLAKVQVEYLVLPGWISSTKGSRSFEQLPENAKRFVRTIEEFLKVPIKWIGTGRDRYDIIEIP